MSGSIFGRVQHSRAAPIAIPPQVITTATRDPVCDCVCTGSPVTGELLSGQSVAAGADAEDWTARNPCDVSDLGAGLRARGIICSSDMVAGLTLDTLPTGTGTGSAGVGARVTYGGQEGYFYVVAYNSTPSFAQFFLSGPDSFTTLASSALTTVASGDTLELSVIGTSIIASHNGSTMFSVTDSSIGNFGNDNPDRPTSYGYFGAGLSGSFASPLVVSNFLVTPVC